MNEYLKKIEPRYTGYQELHVHTAGSFRDGSNSVADVFDSAEELGRNAVAITDHGNWTRLFMALKERTKREKKILKSELTSLGLDAAEIDNILKTMGDFDTVRNPSKKMEPYIEKYENAFVTTAQKAIQFVPGVEYYESLRAEAEDPTKFHIIFYAKDWEGARVLFTMGNLAQLNKHNDIARTTIDQMQFFFGEGARGHGHVIATSACMSGRIPSILLKSYYNREKRKQIKKELALKSSLEEELFDLEQDVLILEHKKNQANDLYKDTKKVAGKKHTTAITRAEKAYQKALDKQKTAQTQFGQDSSDVDTAVAAALEVLEAAKEAERLSNEAKNNLDTLLGAVEAYKAEIKEKKSELSSLKKLNAPTLKLKAQLESLEKEAEEFGDVYADAKELAIRYESIFGKGNFFIELQDHGIPQEYFIRESLIRISKETGIPLTVSNDVHYKDLNMKRKRDILATLRFKGQKIEDVAGAIGNDQLWFKSNAEMAALFADVPEAVENTSRIAEQCNVFYEKDMHLPEFIDDANGFTPDEYLKKVSIRNIVNRYPDCKSWGAERKAEFLKRLDYELSVIQKMGYSSYLSIVEDFISYSRKNFSEDSVGPGRGSGAGSLVCYLAGITNIDPLRYGLIFERFLNPERVSMPDIDTDFAPSIRENVIEYVKQKYAYKEPYWVDELKSTVCSIYTESTLAARSAIRQAGRATGVDIKLCDKIAKMVPTTVGITLKKAMAEVPELQKEYLNNADVRELLNDAILIEGTPSNTGVHAAGVIIADKPISEYAPLFLSDDGNSWIIQYDMVSCENDLGLLKMDFLGLRNLDIIMKAKGYIKKRQNKEIHFSDVKEADDANVIKSIFASGETNGIFQFESGGMKQTLKQFMPETIDDVILLNAAYRPGPMQYIPKVTRVKHGKEDADYLVPKMQSILESTYGSPIYQEQIQQIFNEVAGFSLGEADIIRRAMSKKHLDELEAAQDSFVDGLTDAGAGQMEISKFWEELLEFAKYAFNKSHAAAYSVLSYYTAWLKHYYPVEYLSSLITFTEKDKVGAYINDCKQAHITVLGPDVNCSLVDTAPTKNGDIRYGLDKIKSVGAAAAKITQIRKLIGTFKSYEQFIACCVIEGVNKGAMESLVYSGALDSLIKNRNQAITNLEAYTEVYRSAAQEARSNFPDLEDADFIQKVMELAAQHLPELIEVEEFDYLEKLKHEKDVLGFYTSGHPLEKHKAVLDKYEHTDLADIDDREFEGSFVGHITNYMILARKSDNKPMCKFVLEDLTGSMEVICFTNNYPKYKNILSENAVVNIMGDVKMESDDDGNISSKQIVLSYAKQIA